MYVSESISMLNLLTTCIFQRRLIVTQLQLTILAQQQHISELVEELRTFQGEGSLEGCQSYSDLDDNDSDSYMESTTQGNLEHAIELDHEQLDWSPPNAAAVVSLQ